MIESLKTAQWISSPIHGGSQSPSPCPYFRKSFTLKSPLQSACLAISALGLYEAEINGTRIGDEVFAPGWTDYHKRVPFQQYEVGHLLRSGENVLGAILGDGWYCGHIAWKGRRVYGPRPALLAALTLRYQDGNTETFTSDSSWQTSTGPLLQSDFLMGEDYDARLELTGWSSPGYSDGNWQQAIPVAPNPLPALVEHIAPPVRRIQEMQPVASHIYPDPWDRKYHVYDFGQNFSGRIRIRVKAPAGTVLCFRFSEVLTPDGKPYVENLRAAKSTDYYTCKGEGVETWESRFTFHGFRYAEVFGASLAKDDFIEIVGVVLHSDMKPTGRFSCSNELLNQLQHNILWGQKSNFLEVPTDCPQRDERLGWTGDAQVFVRTASFNMDVRDFFHKWMRDARDSQSARGGIPAVIPNTNFVGFEDGGPAWSDANIICPWTIYLCYGDKKILEDHYDSMQRYHEFLKLHRCKGHIRSHPDVDEWGGFGDWLALDGSGKLEGFTQRDLIGTAFYAYDTELMAKISEVLGRAEEAASYRKLHREIIQAFQQRFITPEGLIVSGTQTAYVLALHFNLAPEHQRKQIAAELVRDLKKRNMHLATGFVGTPYLLEVLEEAGYSDIAYQLLEQESFPSWLFPVKNGATTIWERWDGWTPEKGFQDKSMNSFNHYAYGAVGAWMYRSVAGLDLDPKEPGYKHILFRPRPGGSITWAEASLQTPHGETSIRWELKDGKLEINLLVPQGSHASFSSPEGFKAAHTSYPQGKHHLVLNPL